MGGDGSHAAADGGVRGKKREGVTAVGVGEGGRGRGRPWEWEWEGSGQSVPRLMVVVRGAAGIDKRDVGMRTDG